MLSKKAKYAIHAMLRLAKERNQGPMAIGEIAEKENIPHKFLEAILLELKSSGFISSKKGRSGGYYLRQHPDEINLADIHRTIDGAIALLPCVTYNYYERCEECKDEKTCAIRKAIKEVRDETVHILKKYTLTKLMEQEDFLKEL
ncbi:RrF2 family transcriptional regulator [Gracilimonas mengyeensis]|nr:Rrf2 family transcriptional regulator [Gracilimonas mengyeensis]